MSELFTQYRLDKRITTKIEDRDITVGLPANIKNNLRFEPRPYPVEVFTTFDYFI